MMAIPIWLRDKLFLKETLAREFRDLYADIHPKATGKELKKFKHLVLEKLMFGEHHMSHAASAFFPSPFEEAAILTIDGVGEWVTTSLAHGKGNHIEILKEIHFPHSLGLLYSAFTYYTGFKVNSGEYKVMGLAPYGEPKYTELIKTHLIDIREDGSFRMNMEYFDYPSGLRMTNDKFARLFGQLAREQESTLTQKEMDLAASIQAVTEEVMVKLARHAKDVTGCKNLCLAGGVALNCVGNGVILKEKIFEDIWIQPAAGDAGGALGVALTVYYEELDKERKVVPGRDAMKGSYLGIRQTNEQVQTYLDSVGAVYHKLKSEDDLADKVSDALKEEKIIGWHQGRMEFGPRALGARSIIGDARSPKMQKTMNLKIKYRESFRPFAPSILQNDVSDWFELKVDSPYMLFVAPIKEEKRIAMTEENAKLFGIEKLNVPRSQIPAVTHVDYSARIQTVHEETNPRYYRMIKAFKEKTGSPVIINTSFNVRGEPIVCSPEDSYRCFMRTEIDVLAMEDYILYKEEQPTYEEKSNWREEFELD